MAQCDHHAVLIVTTTPIGTATNLALRRTDLRCGLTHGHEGPHRDLVHEEQWFGEPGRTTTILRDEEEA